MIVILNKIQIWFSLHLKKKDSQKLATFLMDRGIVINDPLPTTRMVMHLDISDSDVNHILKSFDEYYNS